MPHTTRYGTFRAFNEGQLSDLLSQREQSAINKIQEEDEEYILTVGEDAYTLHLAEEYRLEPISFDFQKLSVRPIERMIPAEYFPRHGWSVSPGGSYPKTVLIYQLPYSGYPELLKLSPSSYILGYSLEVEIKKDADQPVVCFENISFDDNATANQTNFLDQTKRQLSHYINSQNQDISNFQGRLPETLRSAFNVRKQKILQRRALVQAIGVPMQKKEDQSHVIKVLTPEKRKKITVKPPSGIAPFVPEPAIDENDYHDILKIITDTGHGMEGAPSLHSGKDEEALRDLILLVLQTNFTGSATAETFNVKGKTDILLKHEASNVFVAECKIWHGESEFLKAIGQLMSYLTYRDSKTALIVFVRTRDFTTTVAKMRGAVKKHPSFITEKNLIESHGSCCRFSLPNDPGKEITIALLAFHLPE